MVRMKPLSAGNQKILDEQLALVNRRTAFGSFYLDSTDNGWREKIDETKLKMDDCDACVLGQAACGYWTVARAKFVRNNRINVHSHVLFLAWALENGFKSPEWDDLPGFESWYDAENTHDVADVRGKYLYTVDGVTGEMCDPKEIADHLYYTALHDSWVRGVLGRPLPYKPEPAE
jgi:hypothetical protein